MRIAFTGTHRVGKTTLAEEIAGILPHYKFEHEPYLQLEEAGHLFSDIPTADDYTAQFDYSIRQIKNAGDYVIFDRCPLDLLAYLYATDQDQNIQKLYGEMTNAMSQIDILVFVPVETSDLIRCDESDLPDLRQEVNDILQNWIEDLDNEVLEVHGTIENRKKQILDKITTAVPAKD